MRQLIGKIKHRGVTQAVYLSEHTICRECQRTAPVGIEVITFQTEAKSKKIMRRACYCRAHGMEYQAQAQAQAHV